MFKFAYIFYFFFVLLNNVNFIKCKPPIKVSIIIPVYNSELYIDRCIQSAIKQTLKEIEIICVDDASTDNSLEILKKYEKIDNRIKVIHLAENKGPSTSRNKGIDLATGEFIGFMDSDDYADNKFFENLYNHSNDYDILIGWYVNETNNSKKYYSVSPYKNPSSYKGAVFSTIWRRDFINIHNIRFDENLRIAEDIMFRNDFTKYNPKQLILPDEGIYYYYKMRVGSISKFSINYIRSIEKKVNRYTRLNKRENKYSKLKRKANKKLKQKKRLKRKSVFNIINKKI